MLAAFPARAALDTPNPLGELVLGDADAPVTIVEYSSLTCPHCAAFHLDILPELKRKYIDTGLVKMHFRPFPLDAYAMSAAMLVHCVAEPRRVAFLDILFHRQSVWAFSERPVDALQDIAQQAGLSKSDVRTCLEDRRILEAIRDMQATAHETLGVRSTPTFFINGEKLESNQPLTRFDSMILPHLSPEARAEVERR